MTSPLKSSDSLADKNDQAFGATALPQSSLSSGWQRWRRLLRCTVAAHMPDAVVRWQPYRVQGMARTTWDAEYAGGHWDYLRHSSELARYGVIASFCHSYTAGGAILDHGCGEGILRRHLNLEAFSEYQGIDLSLDAIAKATHHHGGARTRFMVGDVSAFTPEGWFDVIVFNEMLYYLDNPSAVLQRYEPWLSPSGVFVVSMFDMLKSRKVWHMLDSAYRLTESSRAVNQGGHSWTIRVYRPRPGA